MGAILLLPAIMEIPGVLWYRAEADAGGSGRSLWQSLDLLWRKSLHPKELEDGVCYFRAAQGEALQSSTLPFCHLHSYLCGKCRCVVSVSRELPCRDGPSRFLDATAGCGAQGRALQVVVEPCTAHHVPHGTHVKDARRGKKIWGKCQANAFCWPAGSCVARELFLAELAQRLCLPPLADFHKLL